LLVRALAARNGAARFLFCELPGHWGRVRPREVGAGVFAVRTVRALPDRVRFGAWLNDRLEARQLRRALRRVGIERPALWTQDPRTASLLSHLPVGPVVYDLTDDWAAFEDDPVRRAAVQRRIESLAGNAELVLACSRPLEEQARSWRAPVHYVPNAVEPPGPVDAVELGLPRPVLGYAGTLHDSRLDIDLLCAAAAARPHWSFALLGPDLLTPSSRQRLYGHANIRHLGVVGHDRVREHIAAFDVCLIPHRDTEFTRSLDPLKRYEYLAAGRPVVEETDPHELVAAVERRLAEDTPERMAELQSLVAGETWDARAAQIEAALGIQAPVPSPAPEVSIVVVNHDTRDLLARCLESVHAQEGVQVETIVVDNASGDGSADLVAERFPEVQLVRLSDNAGFARANNVAFDRCRGELVLLLNSDAFLAPGALAELVEGARRHPGAAAVGPRLLNADGTLQRSAWPFPRPGRVLLEAFALHRPLSRLGLLEDLRTWAHDDERAVEFLIGACLLIRRDALAEVGGFDERFWLYGEEADLCRRFAARGWEVVLVPSAECTHIGGASSAGSSWTRLHWFYRGQRNFLRKHSRRGAWPLARLALLIGSTLRARWRVAAVALDPRL
jgi:GT2 family glycosyltransferase